MKINNIKYIMCLIIATQSLCGMERLALYGIEKPVSCATIANMVNVVPGVIAPRGVGCAGNNILVVLEEDTFTVWGIKAKKCIIKREDKEHQEKMHDFAINKPGLQIALSSTSLITVYNACTGEEEWHTNSIQHDFLPIAFNLADRVVAYSKKLHKTAIYSKHSMNPINWSGVSLESNELFTHHPWREQFIFGGSNGEYLLGHYGKEVYSSRYVSFPADHFAIGQLYDVDGSGGAIIGCSGYETCISFIGICLTSNVYAWSKEEISLPQVCVAMAFHPNNKLFFLLDENNTIHCFNYVTKERIHAIHCKDQKKYLHSVWKKDWRFRIMVKHYLLR